MKILLKHVSATTINGIPLCLPGARRWFKHHELDWRDFVRNGIDAEVVLATGDVLAAAVVETAQKMQCEGCRHGV